MNKDLINRILNVSELLGYFCIICLYSCGYWEYNEGIFGFEFISIQFIKGTPFIEKEVIDLISHLFLIFCLRMCSNYIFQLKFNNSIIIFAAKKVLNKFKKN